MRARMLAWVRARMLARMLAWVLARMQALGLALALAPFGAAVLSERADAARLGESCHIHPPGAMAGTGPAASAVGPAPKPAPTPPMPTRTTADAAAPRGTIGPFGGRDTCDAARRNLFGDLGRCHCAPAFNAPPGRGPDDQARGSDSAAATPGFPPTPLP